MSIWSDEDYMEKAKMTDTADRVAMGLWDAGQKAFKACHKYPFQGREDAIIQPNP